jgi:hypothetical protein
VSSSICLPVDAPRTYRRRTEKFARARSSGRD